MMSAMIKPTTTSSAPRTLATRRLGTLVKAGMDEPPRLTSLAAMAATTSASPTPTNNTSMNMPQLAASGHERMECVTEAA